MKKIVLVAGIAGLLVSCGSKVVEETVIVKSYGPAEIKKEDAISTAEMLKTFDASKGEQDFTIEGKITEVCSKAGCWVNIDKGNGETFMVRFKDHFTIPTNTAPGTLAYLHGTAYMDTVSVDELRHYQEDAGKSNEEIMKITEPEFNMNFEADGILFETRKTTKK